MDSSDGQSPPSSADSEGAGLPTVRDHSIDRLMGQMISRPHHYMKLPPLPPSPPVSGSHEED